MKHIEAALRIADRERAEQKRAVQEPVANDAPATVSVKANTKVLDAAKTLPPLRRRREDETTMVGSQQAQKIPPRVAPQIDLSNIVYSTSRSIRVDADVLDESRIIDGRGDDAATRAYKLLRTQVLQRMMREGWRTMAVVSPQAQEGKTLTAINLGIAISSSAQHSVLLVDCDWRQPSVHTRFGFTPEHDVLSHLDDGVPLSETIVNPDIPRFCFVPCKAPVPQSSERLGSARFGHFVGELRSRYANRLVIFDLPPMLLTDDALSFMPHVDCVLVVVEENRTDRDALEQTLKLVGTDRLLGTVLNKSSVSLPGY